MLTQQETSRNRVKQLYERFPYPTPQTDLESIRQGQVLELGFPGIFFHKYWPRAAYRDDLDILIAGCGTTQAARYAAGHPKARVTGIDLSEASLETTRQLAHKHDLKNLHLRQLAVEDARQVDQQYDLIVSTGVIHHLPEPEAGLAALRGLLKPDGVMYLMLYAPHGRDAIYYLQQLLAGLGLDAGNLTGAELQLLPKLVNELPRSHPLWQRRQAFPDLRNSVELVDYLLHPQDRPFTIGQCHDLLDNCGMDLQGLFNQAHYLIPGSGAVGELLHHRWKDRSLRERMELGELYRAALVRHDLIACRSDKPMSQRECTTDLDWGKLVPVSIPALQETRDDLAQGKAAYLRWPGHGFEDIRLPVTRHELEVVRAINGKRSVRDIHEALPDNPLAADQEELRRFLGVLVQYDFIWFCERQ